MQTIPDVVSRLGLGRTPTPEEARMLKHLSAQGVAKLNHDFCQGRDLEHTMGELMKVFCGMRRHQYELERSLHPWARKTINSLGRFVSMEEMLFIQSRSPGTSGKKKPKQDARYPFDYNGALLQGADLEDCAGMFLEGCIALAMEEEESKASGISGGGDELVNLSRLVTTRCPANLFASEWLCAGNSKGHRGVNPIWTWFHSFPPEEPLLLVTSTPRTSGASAVFPTWQKQLRPRALAPPLPLTPSSDTNAPSVETSPAGLCTVSSFPSPVSSIASDATSLGPTQTEEEEEGASSFSSASFSSPSDGGGSTKSPIFLGSPTQRSMIEIELNFSRETAQPAPKVGLDSKASHEAKPTVTFADTPVYIECPHVEEDGHCLTDNNTNSDRPPYHPKQRVTNQKKTFRRLVSSEKISLWMSRLKEALS